MRNMLHLKIKRVALKLLEIAAIKDVGWTDNADEVRFEITIGKVDDVSSWTAVIKISIPNEFFTMFNEYDIATLLIGEIRHQLECCIL